MANAHDLLMAQRAAMMGGWKNPYVTDSLVAMWDGEWNAGCGVHDPNATVWKDLVGTRDATLNSLTGSFDANSLVCSAGERDDGIYYAAAEVVGGSFGLTSNYCFEVVYKLTSKWGRSSTVIGPQLVFTAPVYDNFRCQLGYGEASVENYHKIGAPCVGTSSSFVMFESLGKMISIHYNAIKTNSTSIVFLFGKQVSTSSGSGRNAATNSITFGGNDINTYGMSGNIYCVRVYERNIEDHEILSNYAVDKARFNLPDAA